MTEDPTARPGRPPAVWFAAYVFFFVLVLAGVVVNFTGGDSAVRLVLGVAGALGMIGCGLWLRRARQNRES